MNGNGRETKSDRLSQTEFRRVLNLVADAAIAAIDALDRRDTEGVDKVMSTLLRNTETAQKLASMASKVNRA